MSETATCPHCGEEFVRNGLAAHIKSCKLHPGEEVLREWHAEGVRQAEMARRIGCGTHILKKWLKALGLSSAVIYQKKRKRRPTRYTWVGPLHGRWGSCDETCTGYAVCSTRPHGWPVLCERLPEDAVLTQRKLYGWTPDSYEGVMR